jgi:ATP-binding cassette, subfamily B, bacterial
LKRFVQRPGSTYLRILGQMRSCWLHLSLVAALSLLSLPLTLLYPVPIKIAVDNVLGKEPLPKVVGYVLPPAMSRAADLRLAIGLLLGLALVTGLQGLLSWWLQTYTGEKLVWDFRAQLLNHVQRLPLAFHDRYGSTDSVYRIQHDAPSLQYVSIQGIIPLFTATVTLIGIIYVTARIDLSLALIALTVAPILFVLSLCSSRLVRRRSREVKELDLNAMSVIS